MSHFTDDDVEAQRKQVTVPGGDRSRLRTWGSMDCVSCAQILWVAPTSLRSPQLGGGGEWGATPSKRPGTQLGMEARPGIKGYSHGCGSAGIGGHSAGVAAQPRAPGSTGNAGSAGTGALSHVAGS